MIGQKILEKINYWLFYILLNLAVAPLIAVMLSVKLGENGQQKGHIPEV
jgi:hypothetical protein